ncbi:uncharacterized protein [Solanum tuberosum]|uniref:uncharacterized protein n=1 Tax=Solanum tuberosum TaxID=4113 RepID=UPI00073A1BDB|nr:PREDICTED: uncharacterized protein LOC107060421 [Solanum tuberosum]
MTYEAERVKEKGADESEVIEDPKDDTENKAEVTEKDVPMPIPPSPFQKRLVKKLKRENIAEAFEQMPGHAKFMKDLVIKKREVSFENEERLQHCSATPTRSLVAKKEDPGAFTIPCTIGILHFAKALFDRTVKRPIGVLKHVLMKVESFIFLAHFVILDCEVDFEVPMILGKPFFGTGRALVKMERGQMKFRLNNEEVNFNICRYMKYESDLKSVSVVNHMVEQESEVSIEVLAVIMNFDNDGIDDYDELVVSLDRFEFHFKPKRMELDIKNRDTPPEKSSVDEPSKLEFQVLSSHLQYIFLGQNSTLHVIIVADLSEGLEALVSVLK